MVELHFFMISILLQLMPHHQRSIHPRTSKFNEPVGLAKEIKHQSGKRNKIHGGMGDRPLPILNFARKVASSLHRTECD